MLGTIQSRSRARLAIGAVVVAVVAALVQAAPAAATAPPCVGGPGCSPTVQAAVDAASSGDTIRIARGVFAGGVTISKSLTLVGAGERRTVIRGGGPVVTVKRVGSTRPTVTFARLTITGGVTHGADHVKASGGGIFVPTPDGTLAATVILRHVAVVGNRAEPTATSASPSGVKCPQGFCPFAIAVGGGIATNGDLTLDHARITGNRVTGVASDADGGGVWSGGGALTIRSSTISGNRAEPKRIGRFAEGGGLFVETGSLSISGSRVTGNTAKLVTRWPVRGQGVLIDMNANSGGIHVGDGVETTVDRTAIEGNHVSVRDPLGEPVAFDGGMLVGNSRLTMRSSSVSHNTVAIVSKLADDVGFSGTALELDGPGTLQHVRIVGNSATAYSPRGTAQAGNALAVYDFSKYPRLVTATGLRVADNRATARSPHAVAMVFGAGVLNNSLLTISRSEITRNRGSAFGAGATAQGGGVWNGVLLSGPPVELTLRHVAITHNAVVAPGGTAQGGGIYTTAPIVRSHVRVTHNLPDNCAGSGC